MQHDPFHSRCGETENARLPANETIRLFDGPEQVGLRKSGKLVEVQPLADDLVALPFSLARGAARGGQHDSEHQGDRHCFPPGKRLIPGTDRASGSATQYSSDIGRKVSPIYWRALLDSKAYTPSESRLSKMCSHPVPRRATHVTVPLGAVSRGAIAPGHLKLPLAAANPRLDGLPVWGGEVSSFRRWPCGGLLGLGACGPFSTDVGGNAESPQPDGGTAPTDGSTGGQDGGTAQPGDAARPQLLVVHDLHAGGVSASVVYPDRVRAKNSPYRGLVDV